MLNQQDIDDLLQPVSEDRPCGDDLEYDAAFLALETAAQGKPEQQFGDTVIPALEPDWSDVGRQARELLQRSKDLRAAMLLLRACTRMHGLPGFTAAGQLIQGLLERYWDSVHPMLDVDDDNDPTMRLNALAAFADDATVLQDLYSASVGTAPGVGPIRVRDIAIARNALAATGESLSPSVVQGGLQALQADQPEITGQLRAIQTLVNTLDDTLGSRTSLPGAVDFSKLRVIGQVLAQAASSVGDADAPDEQSAGPADEADGAPAPRTRAAAGEVHSREDALLVLDKVIHYLNRAEPGNPAPLLIERAKRLLGVSFLDIMADLAPNALDTIEVITGKRPEAE